MLISGCIVFVTLFCIQGCIYVPTKEHDYGPQLIRDSDVAAIVPLKTSREEILLKFGDPTGREEDDRYFIYTWERIHGYYVTHPMVILFGIPPVMPKEKKHLFAVEFTSDNVVKRSVFIDPAYFEDPEKRLKQWQQYPNEK